MKRTPLLLVVVIAVIIIAAAAAEVIPKNSSQSSVSRTSATSTSSTVVTSSQASSQSASNHSSSPFQIILDGVVLGTNGGEWHIQFKYVGLLPISTLEIVLWTPTPSVICTGRNGGMGFSNCVAGPGNPPYQAAPDPSGAFQIDTMFSGSSTWTGTHGASIPVIYDVTFKAVYLNGSTANMNSTVETTAAIP